MILGSLGDKLCLCNWVRQKHPGRVDHRLQTLLNAGYTEMTSEIIEETRQSVWNSLMEIPYGQTITYGELATRLGKPAAVRAVANANGANAISIIIPCHRVIGSNNTLTGYGGGLEAKKFLLELEQTQTNHTV